MAGSGQPAAAGASGGSSSSSSSAFAAAYAAADGAARSLAATYSAAVAAHPLTARHPHATLAATLVALLLIVIWAARRRSTPRPTRGFGAGENSWWNRRINTARPAHPAGRHHKLEHAWVYAGAGVPGVSTQPDLNLPPELRAGPLGTQTARDPATGCPLSGHCIGRQTWRPAAKNAPNAAALKRLQDTLDFDPSPNPHAGDKLLRAQMLAAAGADPALANPGRSRGAASISPQEAMELVRPGLLAVRRCPCGCPSGVDSLLIAQPVCF